MMCFQSKYLPHHLRKNHLWEDICKVSSMGFPETSQLTRTSRPGQLGMLVCTVMGQLPWKCNKYGMHLLGRSRDDMISPQSWKLMPARELPEDPWDAFVSKNRERSSRCRNEYSGYFTSQLNTEFLGKKIVQNVRDCGQEELVTIYLQASRIRWEESQLAVHTSPLDGGCKYNTIQFARWQT